MGRLTHELLHTEHPMPAPMFDARLEREGQWSGELRHTTRDGRTIVVDSRQVVMRSADGSRLVLEANRDPTQRQRAEQALEELAGRLIQAHDEERRRISRELYDQISQLLGVLTTQIDQLHADPGITPAIGGALDTLRQGAIDVTDHVRSLSQRLHSSMLDYLGLAPALQKLVADFSERCGIPMHFSHDAVPAALTSEVALALFRVTEESLTNIARHSRARSARVAIRGASDGIHLSIEDDGNGFDATGRASRAGLGFVSMRERLRALGGTVKVDSAPFRGTRIDVFVRNNEE